ncbi:hypothetical protein INH39_21065 [Massilia violaceinigra]|uniref:DUF4236 domain-containing protein n=1 Tax=Massilia violaceinigra TaxID=2045208 RepID=A0ABY3ZZU9_9BURK|nr:hypothetical protein [Massilia violaceinigra]UOD27961.1 hypothetical protein INH39_21065 [Massilia violaceinigra]
MSKEGKAPPLMKKNGKNIWKMKSNAVLPGGIRAVRNRSNKSVKISPLEIKHG